MLSRTSWCFLVHLCLLLLAVQQQAVSAFTEADDAASLLQISAANPGSAALASWEGTTPCASSWQHIVCDATSGQARVSVVNLAEMGLQGAVPLFSGMDQLTKLHLSGNNFTGTLPDAWDSLVNIQHIDLSRNHWQPKAAGAWPAWGNMSSLEWLDLSASTGYTTLITDPLPTSWYDGMVSMSTFICKSCNWVMAADPSMATWAYLAWLDISNNPLSALDTNSLPFTWFGVPTNKLPGDWQTLNLAVLKVRGCNVTASGAAQLAPWAPQSQNTGLINTLKVLDIGDNPLLAFTSMENTFGQMKLWELYLDNTAATLSAGVAGWPNLPCMLEHAGNVALDAAPPEDNSTTGICRSNPQVEWEALLDWRITWTAVPNLAGWDQASIPQGPQFTCPTSAWQGVTCDAETARVTGIELNMPLCTAPCQLDPNLFAALTALTVLSLRSANVAGSLGSLDLSWMFLLAELDLSGNPGLSGPLNSNWSQWMPFLSKLDLNGVKNMGAIPAAWASSSYWGASLQHLALAHGGLSSAIPTPWNLVSLVHLDVSHNMLTGGIGAVITPGLEYLDLSNNSLSGDWQNVTWSTMANLGMLKLNSISMSGSFPTDLLSLPLSDFQAGNTGMTGNLPDLATSPTAATLLKQMQLHGNSLTGPIPANWTSLQALTCISVMDNMGLCGAIPDNLPCFDIRGTNLGKDCANTSTQLSSYTNSKVDVVCKTPTPAPGCVPDCGTAASPTFQYSSGWTPDGRAMDDIATALGLVSHPWPYTSPCSIFLPPPNNTSAGNDTAGMMPAGGVTGFTCAEFIISGVPEMRVNSLDLSALVEANKIPVDKLLLVPEIANLTYLTSFKAAGYPMQSSIPPEFDTLTLLETLDLSSANLSGTIPFTSNMAVLRQLDLSFNLLTGTLPVTLPASLTDMLLQGNYLNESLPSAWSALTNLGSLDVSTNMLTGPLPITWSSMASMQNLRLSHNMFSGGLPSGWADSTVSPTMGQLRSFACASCGLSGPLPAWGGTTCTGIVEAFDVSGNNFTGAVPNSMTAWTSLTAFDVSSNQLSAVFGSYICNLDLLLQLRVAHNSLTGPVPTSWNDFTSLQVLDASYNRLNGGIPDALSNTVQQLYLDHNNFSGPVPAKYNATLSLNCWSLSHNPLLCGPAPDNSRCFDKSGTNIGLDCSTLQPLNNPHMCTMPPSTAQCDPGRLPTPTPQGNALLAWKSSIQDNWSLSSWGVGDPCSWSWVGVVCDGGGQVVGLRLKGMQVSAGGPLNWAALSNVTTLRVLELPKLYMESDSTRFPMPSELSMLTDLEVLNIAGSNMCGQLPASWGNLTALKQLDISYCPWGASGRSIPATWAGMTSLEHLRAVSAALNGNLDGLPVTSGGMPSLRVLQLSDNPQLSGGLPVAWAQRALQVLDVSKTGLQGQLPAAWGDAVANSTLRTTISQLFLHRTFLGGPIPQAWLSGFANITAFTIWGTQVCGPHPVATTGLGSLCLDTTQSNIGYNCSDPEGPPITDHQVPLNCTPQPVSNFSAPSPVQQADNVWDRDKLRLVKAALGNPLFLASWDRYDMPCGSPGWHWVNCGWDGQVSELKFADMGLTGNLPVELGQLKGLEVLDLSRNGFTGSLPGSWGDPGNGQNLRELNLTSNKLTGPLPVNWKGLKALEKLDLSFNNFTGGLPSEWGACTSTANQTAATAPCMSSLRSLQCSACGLSGPLPGGWQHMALQQLMLPHNNITGGLPSSWAQLYSLHAVELSHNQLSEVPAGDYFTYGAKSVKYLGLRGNAINGSLPSGWGGSNLQHIDLSQNMLGGPLPGAWLTGSSTLQMAYINLAYNQLTGGIPPDWSLKPAALHTLILSNNPYMSGDVTTLKLPVQLQALHFANTNMSGTFNASWMSRQSPQFSCLVGYGSARLCGPVDGSMPCSLVNFTQGTNLGKSCVNQSLLAAPATCKLSNYSCLPSLAEGSALLAWKAQLLDPNNTLASWAGPDPCSKNQPWSGIICSEDRMAVVAVNVSGFGLVGPLPDSLSVLQQLQVLDVSRNQLHGALPGALGACSQLAVLSLSNNNFTGLLPSAWAGLYSLTRLAASHNALQGGLPVQWGNGSMAFQQSPDPNTPPPPPTFMASLTDLTCNSCGLSGSLPTSWTGMQQLRHISLAGNNFTGDISHFGAWQLDSLVLDRNNLQTWLSPWWTDTFSMLRKLSVSGCKLMGTLPPEWAKMGLQYLDLSNNLISGSMPDSWANITSGPLSTSLLTLLLNGNQLTGAVPAASPALSCWSVANNWGMCGPVPPAQVCGNINNTNIGRDCGTLLALGAGNTTCTAPTAQCVTLQDLSLAAFPVNPSRADVAGLLALKHSIIPPTNCTGNPVCAIFDSWNSMLEPCPVANCVACTLNHTNCGVYEPATNSTTCNWRLVECTNSRVTRIMLDLTAGYPVMPGSTGPQITFRSLPPSLVTVSQLQELRMSSHQLINGTLPAELSGLTSLRVLQLGGPALQGSSLPAAWSALQNLQSLWLLNMGGVVGGLPDSWSNMTGLQQLRITNAPGMNGSIPEAWSSLANLQQLELSGLSLSGPLPTQWVAGMPALTDIALQHMPQLVLPNASITTWATNTGLRHAVLRNVAGMAGAPLPAGLAATYPNLTSLALSGLGLVGPVPVEWQSMGVKKLRVLDLSGNAVSGPLPGWVAAAMAGDAVLDLSHNAFTGPLPAMWGNQSDFSFKAFSLANNILDGSVPDSWAMLAYNSSSFDLSGNKLQGSLGMSWFNMASPPTYPPRITTFKADNNPCLCGGLPGWATMAINTNMTANMTTNATAANETANSTAGTIFQPCNTPETDAICASSLWSPEFLKDSQQLLSLKSAAADNSTRQRLAGWRPSIPPCTNSTTNGSCVLCDDMVPDSVCGTVRASDGVQLCNWRFIECRNRRVVAINMERRGLMFSSLPPALATGTQLEVLDLLYSPVQSGVLPAEYAAWTNLTAFKVQGKVVGQLPASYTSWTQLRAFELMDTSLNGSIPAAYFTAWPLLQNFTLDGANVSGFLPAAWTCPGLKYYMVQNTPVVSDAANPVWVLHAQAAGMTQMTGLGLGGTLLQLPSWTGIKETLRAHNWTALKMVSFPKLNLAGPVGPLAYYFPQLALLDLSNNQLSGVVPPELSTTYSNLVHVNLSTNALYGTLPSGLAQAFAPGPVYGLDFSRNKLTGPLPSTWGSNTSAAFWSFSLAINPGLTGSIPESWTSLIVNSENFDVSGLQLSGQLPASLSTAVNGTASNTTMHRRKSIRFSSNACLCGPIPAWLTNYTAPDGIVGTGLGGTCPASCSYSTAVPPVMHQDWPGLQALRSAIVGGPAAPLAAINSTWSGTTRSPCHDVDPNCQLCPLDLPASICGTLVASTAGGPPRYYCNAHAVACRDGRVTGVLMSFSGLVFSQLPAGLTQLSKLQELGLEGVRVNLGPFPATWASLTSLVSLNLSVNGAAFDSLPASWGGLPALKHLSISHVTLTTGSLPDAWANATALQSLILRNVSFTTLPGQPLPSTWSALPNLGCLELDRVTGLTGPLPAAWVTGFPSLKALHLMAVPGLNTTLVDYLSLVTQGFRIAAPALNRTGLLSIKFSGLGLTGSIPAAMFVNTGLQSVSLANNQLQGNLDAGSWHTLTSLRHLNLSSNNISGILPPAWAAFRGNISIDVSRNNITGQLPVSWADAGADLSTMHLSMLNASFNSLTGTLPASWANLSAITPTGLVLSHNKLSSGIPDAWGSRNSTANPGLGIWSNLDVANNSHMCGLVPTWFYSRFSQAGAAVPTALLQGTQLGSTCLPAVFDQFLNTINATYPRVGQQLSLQLISKTSFVAFSSSNSSWHLHMSTPGNGTAQLLGAMQQWQNTSTDYYWRFTVPATHLFTAGTYTFNVSSSSSPSTIITNSPLAVQVFPAASAADTSSLTVSMVSLAVGGVAVATLRVNDVNGFPNSTAGIPALSILGSASGWTNVTAANLTSAGVGVFSFSYTAVAIEKLTFSMYVDNMPAGSSVVLAITTVLPSVLDTAASLSGCAVQRDGELTRSSWSVGGPAVQLLSNSWHLTYLPIMRVGGGSFYANPGLSARLIVAPSISNTTASNTTTATNTTAAQLVFQGYWSSRNGSYVVPFKLPRNVTYTGQVELRQSSTSNTTLLTKAVAFNVSQLYAAAAQSSFTLIGPRKAGDPLYIVASLKSALGRPVMVVDNVGLQVTGSISSNITVGALSWQTDNTWAAKVVPLKEESLTVRLTVDGQAASTQTVVIAGRSLSLLALNSSLQHATLVSQGLSVISAVTPGALLMVYLNENSVLYAPVMDIGGNLVTADPGLKAVLTLVPSSLETTLMQRYNLSAPKTNITAHRRALLELESESASASHRTLLQTNATNTTAAPTFTTASGWTYFADYYSSEPPEPVTLDPAPLPPTYVFEVPLGPDLGNHVQDTLGAEAGVTSYRGVFDSIKGVYAFQVWPQLADTYLALLSLRHPNMSGSFILTQFHMAAVPNPAAATTNTSTATAEASTAASVALFNPLVNPRVTFLATFPGLTPSGYPGGSSKALDDFKAIVAANGVLDGMSWVQASVVNGTWLTINATMWFPSGYSTLTSPFEGLSALDYFMFLLKQLPAVAFSSDKYPAFVATQATVASFAIALPGMEPVNGLTYAPASTTTSSTSTTGTTTTGTATAPAVTVVNIQLSELEVVVAPSTSTSSTAVPTPPPVDLTKIVDTSPPVITLLGGAYVSVLQAEKFTDPGTSAYDNIDGNSVSVITRLQLCARPSGIETAAANDSRVLSCGPVLLAVNTTLPSRSNDTYVFTYTARDAAGNLAVPLRRYVVVTARCVAPERWCPDIAACSTQGLCLRALSGTTAASSTTTSSTTTTSTSSSAAAAVYVPPADKTPPKLMLLGTGKAAITASGAVILLDNVTCKSSWSDPGASAIDAVDGDLSARVQSYGAGAVDTSMPTPPSREFSYVVEYVVEDKSGNAAPIARRLIRVVCPKGEAYCVDPDTNQATCTVNGLCGASTLLSFAASGTATTSTATSAKTTTPSSSSSSSSSSKQGSTAATAAAAGPTPPTIGLLIPGPVQIGVGGVYDRCAESAPISAVCERGVAAEDAGDGNMERQVLVCGNRWRPSGNQKPVPVLLACGISADTPGDYNMTFQVTNSAGLSASVTRRITIKPVCPPGEALCADKVTCSEGGSCITVRSDSSGTSGSSAGSVAVQSTQQSSSSSASSAAGSVDPSNLPPIITLITTNSLGNIVRIRQGGSYDKCKDGVAPTADSPCEPGANATDPDGAVPSAAAAGEVGGALDKTSEVVVCPPVQCISSRGCSPVELRRHYFANKGLKGCGIDTSLPEGSQIKIDFWVWDSGSPMMNASVTRTVVIDKPCPDASAPFFCPDTSTGKSFCSGSPCKQTEKLLPPGRPKPHVQLLPNAAPVYVKYGKPAPFFLGACPSGVRNSSCGAVAWDVQPTVGKEDLTPYIKVTQEQDYCDTSDGQACPSCDLAALSASGNCMPGSYLITYSVTSDNGATDSVQRRLVVYQAAAMSASFVLFKDLTNSSEADVVAANLLNTGSQEYSEAASLILENLAADVKARLEPEDVVVNAAHAVQLAASSYGVSVNVSIYVYVPSGTHKKDIDSFEASVVAGNDTAVGSVQRRLLELGRAAAGHQQRWQHAAQHGAGAKAGASRQAGGHHHHSSSSSLLMDAAEPSPVGRFLQLLDERKLQQAASSGSSSRASGCTSLATGSTASGTCAPSGEDAASASSGITSGSVGHRQLLQSSSSMNSLLQSMNSSLTTNLNATGTSQQALTQQEVDLLAAYMSALTSSVDTLEQRMASLDTSGTALSTNINLAFGDEAEQREAQTELQITSMYQNLVTSFQAMVTSLSSLSDLAAQKFDQQFSSAAALSASMSDAIATLRESAALTEAMQEKYVEQTLMLDAATGGLIDDWNCNRTKFWELHFDINRSSSSPTPVAGRRLLASSDSHAANSSQLTDWQGYQVSLAARNANRMVDDGHALPELGRFVGATPGHNRVIGGLFLHTTRKTSTRDHCAGLGFQSRFDFNCHKSIIPLARNATLMSEYLASLFAADSTDIYPYGVDPAFLRSSAVLYRPELQGHEGWFYNVSDALQVPPTTGTPYGFFHQPLKGYPAGFPVLLPTQMSQRHSAAALQYLMDGNCLDGQSKRLTAELLTYNADLRVMGYTQLSFDWQKNGAIKGFVDVRTIPAIKSTAEGGSREVATWLVPLWLLCVAFWITAVVEARKLLAHYEGDRWLAVLATSGDCVLNFGTAAIMLASVILLTVYCTQAAPAVRPKAVYDVYDGVGTARARMFLPAKAYSDAAVADGLAAAAAAGNVSSNEAAAAVLDGGQQPVGPGDAGRWLLPDAAGSEWGSWAQVMGSVHSMAALWAAYTLLQGVILVLLIVKLVRAWSFQSKLGIITNTLIQAAPQLAHLLLVILGCMVLFAGLAYLGLGHRVSYTSSYAAAFEETFRSLLGLGYVKLHDVFPADEFQPWPQLLLSILIYYIRELLFVLVLAQYFMVTLGGVFMQLKRRTSGSKGSSIRQDIVRDVLPELKAKAARALLGPEYSTTARDSNGAAVVIPAGAEALQAFIKAHYPQLVASKMFGDRVPAIQVGDKYLNLQTLQQLLADLAVSSGDSLSVLLQQTGPAKRYSRQSANMVSAVAAGEAGAEEGGGSEAAAAVAAAELLRDNISSVAAAAGGAGAAVAAALAAAEQLMGSCGKAVDTKELQAAQLELHQVMQAAAAAVELRGGRDYTVQDLQAVIDRELELHRQIYSAIWAAVAAMERWSSGVTRWQAKVTHDINSWLAANAQLLAANHGPGGFVAIPAPKEVDLSKSLRPVRGTPSPQLQEQQQQEFGATVVVTAGAGAAAAAGDGAAAGVRTEAELAAATPGGNSDVMQARSARFSSSGGGSWASTAGAPRRMSAVSLEIPRPSVDASRHALGDVAGSTSIRSPGGISLHSRVGPAMPQAGRPSGLAGTLRGVMGLTESSGTTAAAAAAGNGVAVRAASGSGSRSGSPAAGAAGADGSGSSNSSAAGRPHSGQRSSNRIASVAALEGGAAAGGQQSWEESGDSSSVGGEASGGSAVVSAFEQEQELSPERLPTMSGKTPHHHLQPLE